MVSRKLIKAMLTCGDRQAKAAEGSFDAPWVAQSFAEPWAMRSPWVPQTQACLFAFPAPVRVRHVSVSKRRTGSP